VGSCDATLWVKGREVGLGGRGFWTGGVLLELCETLKLTGVGSGEEISCLGGASGTCGALGGGVGSRWGGGGEGECGVVVFRTGWARIGSGLLGVGEGWGEGWGEGRGDGV